MSDCANGSACQSVALAQALFAVNNPGGILLSNSQKRKERRKRQLATASIRACRAELERDSVLDSFSTVAADHTRCVDRLTQSNKRWADRVNKVKEDRDQERLVAQQLKSQLNKLRKKSEWMAEPTVREVHSDS